jgi:hypothetical protein
MNANIAIPLPVAAHAIGGEFSRSQIEAEPAKPSGPLQFCVTLLASDLVLIDTSYEHSLPFALRSQPSG